MKNVSKSATTTHDDEYIRLPGLFRRWEFGQVVEIGREILIDEAGATKDGTPVFAIYVREPTGDS